jgi:hypothetical protein
MFQMPLVRVPLGSSDPSEPALRRGDDCYQPWGNGGKGMRLRFIAPAAGAALLAVALVVAGSANATHVRPRGASPVYVSLVPAFQACAAPNRTHAPPLAFPSCNPPVQTSPNLTIGSPDANGAAANATAFAKLKVVGVPGGVDDSDVLITSVGTDVRCKSGVVTCGSANAADGPDYTGEVQGTAQIKITDHNNAPTAAGPFTDAATMTEVPFPVTGTCVATADTSIGGTCSTTTSADAVVPGSVPEGKRGVVELQQLQVLDGGPDGQVATAPNSLYAVQGIFIP